MGNDPFFQCEKQICRPLIPIFKLISLPTDPYSLVRKLTMTDCSINSPLSGAYSDKHELARNRTKIKVKFKLKIANTWVESIYRGFMVFV